MASTRMTVHLRLADTEHATVAAAFVAELVRQGVVFGAWEDVGTAPSGIAGEAVLKINLSKGY